MRRLELELEKGRRLLPVSVVDYESLLRQRAERLGLTALEFRWLDGPTRHLSANGQPSPVEMHHVEISSTDPYHIGQRFLRRMGGGGALIARMQSLRIHAGDGQDVHFAAHFTLPMLSDAPSESTSTIAEQILALKARRDRLESAFGAIVDISETGHAIWPLVVLEGEIEQHPIALTKVRIGEESSLEGVLLGNATRAALLQSLSKAGFRNLQTHFSRSGGCEKFSIRASTNIAEWKDVLGLDYHAGSFDGAAESICAGLAGGPPRNIVVRGPANSQTESAPYLRFHDVEYPDLFSGLNELLLGNFVVDGDVTGRVTLQANADADLEEIFASISAAGLTISEDPLRRVSRASNSPGSTTSSAGWSTALVTLQVRNALVSDVLRTIAEVSQREIVMPPEMTSCVSVYAHDFPLDQLLDGVIASAGLIVKRDGDRLLLSAPEVGPGRTRMTDGCAGAVVPANSPLGRAPRSVDAYGYEELTLAGGGRLGDGWRGWVYTPSRVLLPVEAGQRLKDATVRSVGPDDLVFETNDKNVVKAGFPGATQP